MPEGLHPAPERGGRSGREAVVSFHDGPKHRNISLRYKCPLEPAPRLPPVAKAAGPPSVQRARTSPRTCCRSTARAPRCLQGSSSQRSSPAGSRRCSVRAAACRAGMARLPRRLRSRCSSGTTKITSSAGNRPPPLPPAARASRALTPRGPRQAGARGAVRARAPVCGQERGEGGCFPPRPAPPRADL
jgi:hypothetical protein